MIVIRFSLAFNQLTLRISAFRHLRISLHIYRGSTSSPRKSAMLNCHVSKVAQNKLAVERDFFFAFLVATKGEDETRGVQVIAN